MVAKNTMKAAKSVKASKADVKAAKLPDTKGKESKVKASPKREGSKLTFKPVKKFKGMDSDSTSASKASNGTARITWNGHPITALLRWMGHQGANVKLALAWCKAVGYEVHPTTVSCQVTSGRAGAEGHEAGKGGWRGPLPKLTKEQEAYLKSIRPAEDAE